MRRNTIFSKTWLQKYFCRPLTKIYVCETTNILCISEFTKVPGCKTVLSYRLNTFVLYFFIRTTYVWLSPGYNKETKWEMRCKEVILNAIVLGGMTSTASVFLFFRQLNIKFVIYDVVSLCWPWKHIIFSHNDPSVIVSQANRSRNTYFSLSVLM